MQTYRGVVVPGRGLGATAMSNPEVASVLEQLLEFEFVPGTLNVQLPGPFEASLGSYVRWEDLGRPLPDPEVPGRRGLRYSRVTIAGRFPGVVFQGDEPRYPRDHVELISDHHLRNTLNLADGDEIEFTVLAGP
ncbi:MAG: DUF120 domain-containing protein [Thermoplasmata archaeon]|nr:DUF120 domain-containing protein [Thermoplasmata archaeon]